MPFTIITMSHQVKEYLKAVIELKLKAEIEAYIHLVKRSNYDGTDIITYNEIAMLSLFKSAILRGEDAKQLWAMQEYEVFDKNDKPKGRADLIVYVRKPNLKCDLLVEAKWDGTYNPDSKRDNDVNYWNSSIQAALKQGYDYYNYEKEYFNDNSFVVTMFFGNYKNEDKKAYQKFAVPKAELPFDKYENEPYQFFITPKGSPNTLCVYGQILKVK